MGKRIKLSFKEIDEKNSILAKKYSNLLGYKCVIDNNNRKAVIIDQEGQIGFLQVINDELCYVWNHHVEPITLETYYEALRMKSIMPKRILQVIYGIPHFNKRSKQKRYGTSRV